MYVCVCVCVCVCVNIFTRKQDKKSQGRTGYLQHLYDGEKSRRERARERKRERER